MSAYILISTDEANNISLDKIKECLKTVIDKFTLTEVPEPFYMKSDFIDEDFEDKILGKMMDDGKDENKEYYNFEESVAYMKKSIANHGGKHK
jgi:hypothetical protein